MYHHSAGHSTVNTSIHMLTEDTVHARVKVCCKRTYKFELHADGDVSMSHPSSMESVLDLVRKLTLALNCTFPTNSIQEKK